MLRNMKDIEGFAIHATDGILGIVRDFYFDDETWVVRYFVVETGLWLANRRTLISPMAMGIPQWSERLVPTTLSQEQVENSPNIDTDKPVSRQHEIGYLGYYGYPNYWHRLSGRTKSAATDTRRKDDLHLRSANSVMRYYVHAADGDIGHVAGILVEEETWAIRYFIVKTSNWWLGHSVLIAPEWIDDVYWEESKLVVAMTRQTLKNSPEYDSKVPITREKEEILHAFYGHTGYWPSEASHDSHRA